MDEKTKITGESNNPNFDSAANAPTEIKGTLPEGFHKDPKSIFLDRAEKSAAALTEKVLTVGDRIKQRFILDKLLGEGGMGTVYRALDLRKQEAGDPQPYVAIKILGESFKRHPRALITLQREAKKTQQLAHPNIVTVYDFDRDDELTYLTMEELKGQSLNDFLKNREKVDALTFAERMRMVLQIAQALSYAHTKGLVHSDLKPANIFLTEDGTIKVLDFGIARAANQETYQDNFDAGELGAITFNYASLEMLNYEAPHPSDDIYALGLIACQIFGGCHPYDGKDANIAREKKLQATIPALNNILLRKLLLRSVALERRNRIADAKAFIGGFYSAVKAPKRIVSVLLLVVTLFVANYLYVQSIRNVEVPFDSLTEIDQKKFHDLIKEGNLALSLGDLEGAAFNTDQAFAIHKTHPDIENLRDRVWDVVENNFKHAKNETEKEFFEKQLQALKEYPAFSDIK